MKELHLKVLAIVALLIASGLSVAYWDEFIGTFTLSRYYSPAVGQTVYYKDRAYDIMMNCGGTDEEGCKYPADGWLLTDEEIGTVFACPPSLKLWSKIKLVFHWWEVEGVCRDRGWAIKGMRLDNRCWYGDEGVSNIREWKGCYTGKAKVYRIIDPPLSDAIALPKEEPKEEPKLTGRKCKLLYTTKTDWETIQIDTFLWALFWRFKGLDKGSKVFTCTE